MLYIYLYLYNTDKAFNQANKNSKHIIAQNLGKEEIFSSFRIRVANVIRDYSDKKPREEL